MQGVYRSMRVEGDKPLVGVQRDMLGVREDGSDIPIEPDGMVRPATGGLSVSPQWRVLPAGLIPRRLKNKAPDARGSNRSVCFRLGDIPFATAPVTADLQLRCNTTRHGTIEPTEVTSIADFQGHLVATRDVWVIDED